MASNKETQDRPPFYWADSVANFQALMKKPNAFVKLLEEREAMVFIRRFRPSQENAWRSELKALESLFLDAKTPPDAWVFLELWFSSEEAEKWRLDSDQKRIDCVVVGKDAKGADSAFACECKTWTADGWTITPVSNSRRLLVHMHPETKKAWLQLNPCRYVSECCKWLAHSALKFNAGGAVFLHDEKGSDLPNIYRVWHNAEFYPSASTIPVYTIGQLSELSKQLKTYIHTGADQEKVEQFIESLHKTKQDTDEHLNS